MKKLSWIFMVTLPLVGLACQTPKKDTSEPKVKAKPKSLNIVGQKPYLLGKTIEKPTAILKSATFAGPVTSMALSPGGKTLALTGSSKVTFWNMTSKKEGGDIAFSTPLQQVLSGQKKWVVLGDKGQIHLVLPGNKKQLLKGKGTMGALSPD